jgi:hypothetical protein
MIRRTDRAARLLLLCCRVRDQLRRGVITYVEWERRGRAFSSAYNRARYGTNRYARTALQGA